MVNTAKGMSAKEAEDRYRELVFNFFAAPVVILIGMYAAGSIIDIVSNTHNTFVYIFLVIGGVPSIGFYYYQEWKKFKNSQK